MSFIQEASSRMKHKTALIEKNKLTFKERRGDYQVKSASGHLTEQAKQTLKKENIIKIRSRRKQQEGFAYLAIFSIMCIVVLWFLVSY